MEEVTAESRSGRRSSLLGRALGVVALVFGLTTAAIAVSSAWRVEENLTEQFKRKGAAIAGSIAGSSAEILLFRDVSTVQAMMDQYLEIPGIAYLYVVDPRGQVLAHTFVPQVPAEVLTLVGERHALTVRTVQIPGLGNCLDVSAPILAGQVGHVHVGMDRRLIHEAIWDALLKQAAVLGVIFVLSMLLAMGLMRRLIEPLHQVTGLANRLAAEPNLTDGASEQASELEPITRKTDEVGQLAQAFQLMVGQVASRERALRQAQGLLEQRVRARTAELTAANERLRDEIGERERAEAALAVRADQLASSNAELEQFAYVASHDLQEPLRMIASYTQLLGRRYQGKLDGDADKFIGYAVDGARRMQDLINDLLTYSRVGRRGERIADVNSSSSLDAALANLGAALQESGAVVTRDPLPTVRADRARLTQVFQNLLGNAVKFRHPEIAPAVHVSAIRQEEEWIFSVRDNGIGIAPEHRDRIFLIFQRLHTRDEYAGTGIGLAICKKIVETHGGRMWIESEPGQGTTFYFTIPLTETPVP